MLIYRIYCTKTGRSYVGRTKSPQARVSQHFCLLRDGKHPSARMQDDYNTHSAQSFKFEILERIHEPIRSRERETFWMLHFACREYGYNRHLPTTRSTTDAGVVSNPPLGTPLPKSIAQLIRHRREILGISQLAVARAIGFSTGEGIGMIETGRRGMDLTLVPRLASVLELSEMQVFRVFLMERCPSLLKHLKADPSVKNS